MALLFLLIGKIMSSKNPPALQERNTFIISDSNRKNDIQLTFISHMLNARQECHTAVFSFTHVSGNHIATNSVMLPGKFGHVDAYSDIFLVGKTKDIDEDPSRLAIGILIRSEVVTQPFSCTEGNYHLFVIKGPYTAPNSISHSWIGSHTQVRSALRKHDLDFDYCEIIYSKPK